MTFNLPKNYVQRLEYTWVWLKQNVPNYVRVLNAWTRINFAEEVLNMRGICLKYNVKDTVKLL